MQEDMRVLTSACLSLSGLQFILVPFFAWKASHNAHHASTFSPCFSVARCKAGEPFKLTLTPDLTESGRLD